MHSHAYRGVANGQADYAVQRDGSEDCRGTGSTGPDAVGTSFPSRFIANVPQPHCRCLTPLQGRRQSHGLPLGCALSYTSCYTSDFPLAEVEERRKPGSSRGKRKASGSPAGDDDEESGLQRAVKKLIRQAQLEADSPVHSVRSGSASSGSTPHQGRMDMRIFSDTPRDRPVFDAYPMPTHAQQVNAANMLQVAPTQPNPTSTSPFTFPVDTTSATNFPNFASGAGFPQLDPAVESILLNYFPSGTGGQPQQGMGGPVGTTQVPDDFVSRVFNFGWEGGNSGQGGVPQNGGQQVQGQDGFDLPGYEGWGAHGWMA